jgi:hypothetical protein
MAQRRASGEDQRAGRAAHREHKKKQAANHLCLSPRPDAHDSPTRRTALRTRDAQKAVREESATQLPAKLFFREASAGGRSSGSLRRIRCGSARSGCGLWCCGRWPPVGRARVCASSAAGEDLVEPSAAGDDREPRLHGRLSRGAAHGRFSAKRLKCKLKVRTGTVTPLVSRGIETRGETLLRALLALRAERVGNFVLAVLIIPRIPRFAGGVAALRRRERRGTSTLIRAAHAHVARGVGAVRVRRIAVRLRRVAIRRRAGPPGAKHRRRRRAHRRPSLVTEAAASTIRRS